MSETKIINFRVPPRIAREIKTFAARHDMTLSAVLREAFADLQAKYGEIPAEEEEPESALA
jgi:antitoxin component of RelBE/YafQ-DinJ toxin-antitoxin module